MIKQSVERAKYKGSLPTMETMGIAPRHIKPLLRDCAKLGHQN